MRNGNTGKLLCVLAAVVFVACPAWGSRRGLRLGKGFKAYKSTYYVIHSDREIAMVREAHARLTAMAEEYHRRTRGFAGRIPRKLPFYLFAKPAEYYASGGLPGSAGVFMGGRLMALATPRQGAGVWRTVQHEGFHQFAHSVISDRLPVWVSEGLADYFGAGIWTGDGLVTGVIPRGRLRRVKTALAHGTFKPLKAILTIDQAQWNREMNVRNYVQAWSICHFLVHGDDGKYRKAFESYIKDVSRGRSRGKAFTRRFGKDLGAFEVRHKQWWTALGNDPTAAKRTEAIVQTLTSYLARGQAYGLKFETAEAFFAAARAGKLTGQPKKHPKLWLPDSLLNGAMKQAGQLKAWSLTGKGRSAKLVLTLADGTVMAGEFTLRKGKSPRVKVAVTKLSPTTKPAKRLAIDD